MAADDPVDDEAMIFTEADIFMICGYLAEEWGIGNIEDSVTEDTEHAISVVLAEKLLS